MSVRNRYELYLMIFHFYCVNPWNRCIICRCFWKNIIRYRNMNNYVFSLYISFDRRSRSFLFKKGEGWGTVRFLYAVNVVILIIFFFSFHNNTSVVWISKTVSIDANYLLKLETFLIQFYEGKGTCIRSSEGDQLFLGKKKKKKSMAESREFIKIVFFVSCHVIKPKANGLNRLKAKNHQENLYQSGKVFLSKSIIFHWVGDRPNFGQKLLECSFRGPILFPFIDFKYNDRKVNKYCFFLP